VVGKRWGLRALNAAGVVFGLPALLLAVWIAGLECFDVCENGMVWSPLDVVEVSLGILSFLATILALLLAVRRDARAVRATWAAWLGWAVWLAAAYAAAVGA
jgi:hypothetical protein